LGEDRIVSFLIYKFQKWLQNGLKPSTKPKKIIKLILTGINTNWNIECIEGYNKRRIRLAPLTRKSAISKKNQDVQENTILTEKGVWRKLNQNNKAEFKCNY